MTTPRDYLFTKDHEWLAVEKDGKTAKIGISDYAQHKLGDITYIEIPGEGKNLKKGDVLTTVESVKAASDVFTPVSGKISAVNGSLEGKPEIINTDPYNEGWIAVIEIASPEELKTLMNGADYDAFIGSLE